MSAFVLFFKASILLVSIQDREQAHAQLLLVQEQSGNHCSDLISWCEELIFHRFVYIILPVQ